MCSAMHCKHAHQPAASSAPPLHPQALPAGPADGSPDWERAKSLPVTATDPLALLAIAIALPDLGLLTLALLAVHRTMYTNMQ